MPAGERVTYHAPGHRVFCDDHQAAGRVVSCEFPMYRVALEPNGRLVTVHGDRTDRLPDEVEFGPEPCPVCGGTDRCH